MPDRLLTAKMIASHHGSGLLAGLGLLCCVSFSLPVNAQQATAPNQSLAEIMQTAEQYARSLLDEEDYAGVEVTASALDGRLRLKQCELPLESFSTSNTVLRGGRTTVGVRCTGAAPWTLYVPVAVVAEVSVVQVRGPLERGAILTEADLELVRQPMSGLPQNTLNSIDQALGRELTRAVSRDTLATMNMLRIRELVAKGQEVVILAQGSNIEVRMAGVALEKGQQGERISVRNTNSGKTVEGVILNETTVKVQL